MALPTPNKETIRRICTLFKCSRCWLLIEEGQQPLLFVNLDSKHVTAFKKELMDWSGFSFIVCNTDSAIETVKQIQQLGEKLLPVDRETPFIDIQKRRKPTQQ